MSAMKGVKKHPAHAEYMTRGMSIAWQSQVCVSSRNGQMSTIAPDESGGLVKPLLLSLSGRAWMLETSAGM